MLIACRTAFIVGPTRQFESMFSPVRLLSGLIYIAATVAVLLVALRGWLVLASILFIVQVCSLVWYAMSYVPYAQKLFQRMIS